MNPGDFQFLAEIAYFDHKDRNANDHFRSYAGYIQVGYEIQRFTPYLRYDFRDMARKDVFFTAGGANLDRTEALAGIRSHSKCRDQSSDWLRTGAAT